MERTSRMRRAVAALVLGSALVAGACTSAASAYPLIEPDTMDIWGVGDSFARGIDPAAPGWADVLETYYGGPVANMGLGAGTYSDIYQFLVQQTAAYGYPTKMVVMAGANDLASNVPLSYIQANAVAVSSLAVAHNVDVTFVTIPPTHPDSGWAGKDSLRVQFNDWLLNSSMNAIDCSTQLQDGQWIDETYVWPGDYSHLSVAGVDLYASCIAANI